MNRMLNVFPPKKRPQATPLIFIGFLKAFGANVSQWSVSLPLLDSVEWLLVATPAGPIAHPKPSATAAELCTPLPSAPHAPDAEDTGA